MPAGRFAPSPSGELHLGNLRTAWLAWQAARQSDRQFFLRIEDIDSQRCQARFAQQQIEDLLALGLEFDGPVLYQTSRFSAYEDALSSLYQAGLAYECYCSRADIRAASSAPHGSTTVYPGTCRDLSAEVRAERREALAAVGRVPSWRLRAPMGKSLTVYDERLGSLTGQAQDVVLRRSDGDWAYNLAVVVDDIFQGVDQVVRGEDLANLSPTQAFITVSLGSQVPSYRHVPLWLGPTGKRLAKRDGAVTRRQLLESGFTDNQILELIKNSLV